MLHNLFIFSLHYEHFRGRETRIILTKFNQNGDKSTPRLSHYLLCPVFLCFFFLYKIQNDGHHLEIPCTRSTPLPRLPPQKDVPFHQTKITLFNSSCLLLTGNKSNTAGRKSVDLKKTKNKTKNKTKKNKTNKCTQLDSGFWTFSCQRAPTRDVITLHMRCSRFT